MFAIIFKSLELLGEDFVKGPPEDEDDGS